MKQNDSVKQKNNLFYKTTFVITGILGIILLFYSIFRKFDGDEFEALHTAYKVFKGKALYVDFFQHHHPLLYHILKPIFWLFGATTFSVNVTRFFMFIIFLLTTATSYLLSKLLFNKNVAIINTIILWTTPLFCIHGIEIRPDSPQVFCGLLSLYLFFLYLKKKKLSLLISSSFCIFLAFMFLQKAIFLMFFIGLILLYNAFKKNISVSSLFIYGATFIIPYGIYILSHVLNGTFSNYFTFAWLFCTHTIKIKCLLFSTPYYAYKTAPFFWLFFLLGSLFFLKKSEQKQLLFVGTGLLLSIFIVPVPFHQYVYPALPIVSIIASNGIYSLFKHRTKVLLAVLIFMSILPTAGHLIRRIRISPNTKILEKINYVKSISSLDDYMLDSQGQSFDIFWNNLHFFWFDTLHGLKVGKLITNNEYAFDIFELIEQYKPKVIGQRSIEELTNKKINEIKDKRFINFYKKDKTYNDLFIRVDTPENMEIKMKSPNNKYVLITGGSGFFGNLLKQHLLNNNFYCINIDLQKDHFEHPHLLSIKGDIRDKELLNNVFNKYEFTAIFHFAAILAHDVKDKNFLWESNVNGTENIADFAKKFHTPKVIFTSSNCLWAKNFHRPVEETDKPEPIEIYGKSKLAGEKILLSHSSDFDSIIFRCPTIIDSGRLGLLAILFEFIDENRKVWLVGAGENKYQFIYAQDLIEACMKALNYNHSDVFNIGSDDVKSFKEVYKYVIQKAHSKSRVANLPKKPAIAAMKLAHILGISPLGPYQYKMIAESFVFDTTKIKEKLHWQPTLTNEEMLFKSYDFYHQNRQEIEQRKNVSAHNRSAKMGVIKILKWIS
jgi:UDP-glucose 4-epimerase